VHHGHDLLCVGCQLIVEPRKAKVEISWCCPLINFSVCQFARSSRTGAAVAGSAAPLARAAAGGLPADTWTKKKLRLKSHDTAPLITSLFVSLWRAAVAGGAAPLARAAPRGLPAGPWTHRDQSPLQSGQAGNRTGRYSVNWANTIKRRTGEFLLSYDLIFELLQPPW